MKAEKSGGKAKSKRMLIVQCTICGADRHFCARCTDMLAEGYEELGRKGLAV